MGTTPRKPRIVSCVSATVFLLACVFCSPAAWAQVFPEADVSDPFPAHGTTNVSLNPRLSWMSNAPFFSLVIGTDLEEVATTIPADIIDDTAHYPGTLKPCTTYYWRVIEILAFGYGIGPIWQFTTGECPPAEPATLLAHWKADAGPDASLQDDSGNGLHAEVFGDPMWVYGLDQFAVATDGNDFFRAPPLANGSLDAMSMCAWLFPTDVAYTYTGIMLTQGVESAGLRLKPNNEVSYLWKGAPISEQFSTGIFLAPEEWSFVALVVEPMKAFFHVYQSKGVFQVEHPILHPSCPFDTHLFIATDSTIDGASFVGLLDDLRLYAGALTVEQIETIQHGTPSAASLPVPMPYTEIETPSELSWAPAPNAVTHEIYVGPDFETVANATPQTEGIYQGQQDTSTYALTTLAGQPYSWRIDELDAQGQVTTGTTWSFIATDDLTIDDMESYTDDEPMRIFDRWSDGYDDNTNGSLVGHWNPPIAEQTLTLFGHQSLPFYYNYDNTSAPIRSEISLDLDENDQNLAQKGATHLILWCRGDWNNTITPDDTLYVLLNNSLVNIVPSDFLTYPIWTPFYIPLEEFPGLDTSSVTSITLGIGNAQSPQRSGSGVIYIDNIKLAVWN